MAEEGSDLTKGTLLSFAKTLSVWTLLLYVVCVMGGRIFFLFVLSSLCGAVHNQDDVWSSQLGELKMMLTTIESKMSTLDKKMTELNFLEYAFQVNNVDNNLAFIKQAITNLDTRMTRMEAQTKDIKERLMTTQTTGASCGVVSSEKERISQPIASQRVGGEALSCHNLTRKIEDYGFKITKSQQELKDNGRRHQEALGNLLETVRNGFTKTFQKVDVLPATERRLAQLSSSISELPSQLPRVLERLSSISDRLISVQSEITTVSQRASDDTGKSSDRTTAVLNHAVDLGNRLKADLSQLVKTEADITSSRKMAKDLLTGIISRRPTSIETLKNLTNTLENLEDKVVPLFFSVPYKVDSIHELLESTLASADKNHTTVCNFKEVFKLELNRINDNLDKAGAGNCAAQPVDDSSINQSEKGQESFQSMKQQDVFENLVYVRAALAMVKTDLQHIFRKCSDGSVPTVKPLGMIMG